MQDIDTPSFAGQESEAPITKTSSLLSAIHTHQDSADAYTCS